MKRILGALLFAPIAILLVYFSTPLIFFIAVSVVVGICMLEFYRLMEERGTPVRRYAGVFLGVLVVFAFYQGGLSLTAFIVSAGTIGLFMSALVGREDLSRAFEKTAYTLVGIFYVGWLLAHLVLLHRMDGGRFYILFLLLVIWFGDIAAYYVGKNFGRRKLASEISPAKTVEGTGAGLGGSVAGAFVARWLFLGQLSAVDALFLGVLLGLLGQLGDLSESVVKRSAGAKDSGRLIPGHGGLLDRLDSLLFSAPILYYYMLTWVQIIK